MIPRTLDNMLAGLTGMPVRPAKLKGIPKGLVPLAAGGIFLFSYALKCAFSAAPTWAMAARVAGVPARVLLAQKPWMVPR